MQPGAFSGPTGETLFNKPFFAPTVPYSNELPELFEKVEELHDHRLLSLVTALIVENRLDKLLDAHCPRYNRLIEASQFTFSIKIRMLEALCLIPYTITEACNILREIRNEFAHNLEKTKFSDLPEKEFKKIEGLLSRTLPDALKTPDGQEEMLFRYKTTAFIGISGLDSYVVNVKVLRSTFADQKLLENIQGVLLQDFIKKMEGKMGLAPMGDKWEVIHNDGRKEIVDKNPLFE